MEFRGVRGTWSVTARSPESFGIISMLLRFLGAQPLPPIELYSNSSFQFNFAGHGADIWCFEGIVHQAVPEYAGAVQCSTKKWTKLAKEHMALSIKLEIN
jgi:hypothetical protein